MINLIAAGFVAIIYGLVMLTFPTWAVSAVLVSLANRWAIFGDLWLWIIVGAGVGCTLQTWLISSPWTDMTIGTAAFGSACGITLAALTHRFIQRQV
jgi:uncharacterized membrane protein YraQ (UPF0718 family)